MAAPSKRVKAARKTLKAILRRGKLQDKSLGIPDTVAEIIYLQKKLKPLLRRAWPAGSEKDVSWLTVDLAALFEVSRRHVILVQNLLKMGDRPNRRRLQLISQKLDVNWFSNASAHMETMRVELTRFKESLYGQRGKQRKRKPLK